MASAPEHRIRARSFGGVAAEYDRGRPGYPREAIDWLLGVEPLTVLDLGAGTGKLSAAVAAAGHEVIALEPLPEMRAILSQRLPQVSVLAGRAERLDLPDASVDAVLAGAAFHWFDHELALAEAVRVLRPGGRFGLLGNRFDAEVPWVAALRGVLGSPSLGRPGHWPSPERLAHDFEGVETAAFRHEQEIDLPGLRDLAVSRSNLAIRGPAARAQVLARLDDLWSERPELAGRERVQLSWVTEVGRGRRR